MPPYDDNLRNQQQLILLETAKRFLGTPYRWGGDDVLGIDCSGMVIECLKACGLMKSHEPDTTADGLWKKFSGTGKIPQAQACALAFWFNDEGKAYHVAVCTSAYFCITADGGGSKTNTLDDADKQNAFVKYRPIDHRGSKPLFVNIFG